LAARCSYVRARRPPPLWLVSGKTLDAIPPVYGDIGQQRARMVVPRFLFE
jgi:hypothetical protein